MRATRTKFLAGALAGFLFTSSLFNPSLPRNHQMLSTPNYLHTSGSQILDVSNQVVGLSGLNWFGFETSNNVPHGLWTRNWQDVLDLRYAGTTDA